MSDTSESAAPGYLCPDCGQALRPPDGPTVNVVKCPGCGREFFLGPTDDEEPDITADVPPTRSVSEQAEFDLFRIRQTVALRRGIYRGRAYAVIASVVCAAAAAQGAYLGWQQARGFGWNARAMLFIVLMFAAVWGTIWFAARARALHREAKRSVLPEPSAPPDFSTLGDGSQRARNLDQIR